MLLRGQNLIGYKQYPDDVVEKFVEPAAFNTNTADSETSNTSLMQLNPGK